MVLMNNFTFYSPTCFVFGKDTENQAGALVKRFGGSRVLIHYGGGSAKRISPPWSTPSAGVTGAREVSPVLSPSARKTAKRFTG